MATQPPAEPQAALEVDAALERLSDVQQQLTDALQRGRHLLTISPVPKEITAKFADEDSVELLRALIEEHAEAEAGRRDTAINDAVGDIKADAQEDREQLARLVAILERLDPENDELAAVKKEAKK